MMDTVIQIIHLCYADFLFCFSHLPLNSIDLKFTLRDCVILVRQRMALALFVV